MRNRLLALFVSLVLLFALLPLTTFAATGDGHDALVASTKESYTKAQEDAQQESFNGFCGRLTSYQLWNMGINSSLLTADGNKQFEMYSAMKRTSTGYYVCSYSAEEYTLERALNVISCNGTKNVYNLLVCFDWTNTEAGNIYGHAVVINGILNGKVYFVESFYTQLGGEEGNVVVCSIAEFANIFEDWTLFEGVIHFAGFSYADACKSYPTDMFVRTRYAMELRSQPSVVGQDNCKMLRSVSSGERLRVTAVLKNTYGQWYYQVEDGNQIGYIVADTAVLDRINTEEITLKYFKTALPKNEEQDLQIAGTVRANKGLLGSIEIVLTDANGEELFRKKQITDDYRLYLVDLNEDMNFPALEEGVYTLSVYGETATAYISRGALCYTQETFLMEEQVILVGDAQMPAEPRTVEAEDVKNGWCWIDGTWYLYENDCPKTGWVKDRGIWYYLQEDGAVTTGREKIGEKTYYFTDTGAMCIGWAKTNQGLRYLLEDGTVATGWQIIDGSRYYFDTAGNMQRSGTRQDGNVKYRFQYDGRAVEIKAKRVKE